MSHQLALVFISLSVEWGLRAERVAGTEGQMDGSSGCGQTRCHWGRREDRRGREPVSVDCELRARLRKHSDKQWEHLKGSKEQSCVWLVAASSRGCLHLTCPSSLYPCVLSSSYEDWVIGFRVHSKPRSLSSQDSSVTASAKSLF